jgi:hypothetical protein
MKLLKKNDEIYNLLVKIYKNKYDVERCTSIYGDEFFIYIVGIKGSLDNIISYSSYTNKLYIDNEIRNISLEEFKRFLKLQLFW